MRRINLQKVVREAISEGAKSVFPFPGFPPTGNKREIIRLGSDALEAEEVEDVLRNTTTEWQRKKAGPTSEAGGRGSEKADRGGQKISFSMEIVNGL